MDIRSRLLCTAFALCFLALSPAAFAEPVPLFEGSVSALSFDAKAVDTGPLWSLAVWKIPKTSTDPNVEILGQEGTGNLLVDVSINMEDLVYLHATGKMLTPDGNRSIGHLDGSNGTGVVMLEPELATFDPATGTFSVPDGTAAVIVFGFAAEAKGAVSEVDGMVAKGTLKLKIMPTGAELIMVTDGQTVADVAGTGQPLFMKIKVSTIKFVPVPIL